MKTRILCVEDDKVMQSMIAMSLQEFSLAVAASLSEAEKALRSQEFDALVLDISLPDGDGLKFWSKLRNEARFASVPVIS